ncbi:hypothetical protein PRIPAC_80590 [Pristionchus pacificus]|uniref:Serpentine receptor class r-10 n=1 Tax=Pristionchus pacificus TaxID=54126 RepID=A0A2A6CPN3_PRIPA|nr:hypothetical protein PRIPAC_80590 [Pristionchus pacificus]|eukprot:PDM80068.1 G protein-coupled receptor [Pristionchus pacificus]
MYLEVTYSDIHASNIESDRARVNSKVSVCGRKWWTARKTKAGMHRTKAGPSMRRSIWNGTERDELNCKFIRALPQLHVRIAALNFILIANRVEIVNYWSGLLLNLILVFLILKVKKGESAYKVLQLTFVLNDLAFATLSYAFGDKFITKDHAFAMFLTRCNNLHMICVFASSFVQFRSISCRVQFPLPILGGSQSPTHQALLHDLVSAVSRLYCNDSVFHMVRFDSNIQAGRNSIFFYWYTTCFFLCAATEEARRSMIPEFKRKYGLDAMTHATVLSDYYSGGQYHIRPLAGVGVFMTIISTGLAFMVFCMISILRYLSQAKAISDRTKQLQNALFRTLTVQTIVPVVFLHANAGNTILMPLFGIDCSLFCDFISVGCSCFPPFDAIATILLMRDYRNTAFNEPSTTVVCIESLARSGLALNLILVFLILKVKKGESAYKFLQLTFVLNDLLFATISYTFGDKMITKGHAFAMFLTRCNNLHVICTFASCFSTILVVVAYNFLYRYWAVVRYSSCFFLYVTTDEARRYMAPEFKRKYGLDSMTYAIVLADYYRDGQYNIRPLAGVGVFMTLISAGIAFMVFCMISILRYLTQAKAISDRTKQLQYALFRTLTVQTIVPVVFLHATAGNAILMPLFGIDFSMFCDFISVSCSCFPPFDAIATILLMRDYRNTTINEPCATVIRVESLASFHYECRKSANLKYAFNYRHICWDRSEPESPSDLPNTLREKGLFGHIQVPAGSNICNERNFSAHPCSKRHFLCNLLSLYARENNQKKSTRSHCSSLHLMEIIWFATYRRQTYRLLAMFSLIPVVISFNFLYRYWAVVCPQRIQLFSKYWFTLLLVFVAALELILWYASCFYLYVATDEARTFLAPELARKYDQDALTDDRGRLLGIRDGHYNIRPLVGVVIFLAIICAGFAFMMYCAGCILWHLGRAKATSAKNEEVAVRAVSQSCSASWYGEYSVFLPGHYSEDPTLIPLIFIHADSGRPETALLFSDWISMINSFFPPLDAIATMLLMRDYRRALVKALRMMCSIPSALDENSGSRNTVRAACITLVEFNFGILFCPIPLYPLTGGLCNGILCTTFGFTGQAGMLVMYLVLSYVSVALVFCFHFRYLVSLELTKHNRVSMDRIHIADTVEQFNFCEFIMIQVSILQFIFFSGVGLCMNLLLAYLIIFARRTDLGKYKYLQKMINKDYSFAMFLTSSYGNNLGEKIASSFPLILFICHPYYTVFSFQHLVCTYGSMYSLVLVIVAFNFLYRYWAVVKPPLIELFSTVWFPALLALIAALEFAVWYAACYFLFTATPGAREDLVPEFAGKYGLDAKTHAVVLGNYWRDGHYNAQPIAGLAIFFGIICACVMFMVFCTAAILRQLSQAKAISTKTKKLQYALFRSLAVQTIIPLIFLHANGGSVLFLPLFGIDLSWYCDWISVSKSCFPPFDAVATIMLMRDYRETVVDFVMCRYCSGGIAMSINSFFLFLIIFKSPPSLTPYKVLIANSAVTDLIFSASTTFLQCRIIPNKWAFAYVALGPAKYFGEQLHSLFYMFLCFPVSSLSCDSPIDTTRRCTYYFFNSDNITYMNLQLSFGFRYYILVRPIPTMKQLGLLLFCIWLLPLAQSIAFVNSQSDSEAIRAYLSENRPEYNMSNHLLWQPLTGITLCSIVLPMFPIYGVIVFFFRKVHDYLDRRDSGIDLQAATKRSHKRLIKALAIQAALPLFFVFPPIAVYGAYHLQLMHATIAEYLVYAIFSIMPAVSPVVSMFFIRPYYLWIKRRKNAVFRLPPPEECRIHECRIQVRHSSLVNTNIYPLDNCLSCRISTSRIHHTLGVINAVTRITPCPVLHWWSFLVHKLPLPVPYHLQIATISDAIQACFPAFLNHHD